MHGNAICLNRERGLERFYQVYHAARFIMLPAESAVHYRLVFLMGYDGHIYRI